MGCPDDRCGFTLDPEEVLGRWDGDVEEFYEDYEVATCYRDVWRDGRCIWHAEVGQKPLADLKAARADRPERLDGAYLVGVEAGNELSFRGCTLMFADLRHADFTDADLSDTDFTNADLRDAVFINANLYSMFSGNADFTDAYLENTDFTDTDLRHADFTDAILRHADFTNAYLSHTDFTDAYLRHADFTDAILRHADLIHATLHDALLTRTDCRGTTFTSSLLYETVFADTRINSHTTFYDPETTSRPTCVYEENPLTTEDLPGSTHTLEAAEWVYRRLETLHEQNALSEEARKFHISKEEARRAHQREQTPEVLRRYGEGLRQRLKPGVAAILWPYHRVKSLVLKHESLKPLGQYAVSTLNWHLHRHGESLRQLLKMSALVILTCSFLYVLPWSGVARTNQESPYRITSIWEFLRPEAYLDWLNGLYFSVITFSTIGYGDFYPASPLSRLLVGIESLAGALLIALFVFVLGRRVAR